MGNDFFFPLFWCVEVIAECKRNDVTISPLAQPGSGPVFKSPALYEPLQPEGIVEEAENTSANTSATTNPANLTPLSVDVHQRVDAWQAQQRTPTERVAYEVPYAPARRGPLAPGAGWNRATILSGTPIAYPSVSSTHHYSPIRPNSPVRSNPRSPPANSTDSSPGSMNEG